MSLGHIPSNAANARRSKAREASGFSIPVTETLRWRYRWQERVAIAVRFSGWSGPVCQVPGESMRVNLITEKYFLVPKPMAWPVIAGDHFRRHANLYGLARFRRERERLTSWAHDKSEL